MTISDIPFILEKAVSPESPVILVCPGLGMPARRYKEFVKTLTEHGFSSAVFDLRGQGNYRPGCGRNYDHGIREIIDEDLSEVLRKVHEKLPGSPIILCGHSLGGRIAAMAAASKRLETPIAGVVTVATSASYYKMMGRRKSLVILQSVGLSTLLKVFSYFPGEKLGFGGPQPRTLMREWSYMARTGKLNSRMNRDYEQLVIKSTIPVLAVAITEDVMAPRAAVDHFAQKFVAAHVTRVDIDIKNELKSKLSRHSAWLENPDIVSKQIRDWAASANIFVGSA